MTRQTLERAVRQLHAVMSRAHPVAHSLGPPLPHAMCLPTCRALTRPPTYARSTRPAHPPVLLAGCRARASKPEIRLTPGKGLQDLSCTVEELVDQVVKSCKVCEVGWCVAVGLLAQMLHCGRINWCKYEDQ